MSDTIKVVTPEPPKNAPPTGKNYVFEEGAWVLKPNPVAGIIV